MLFSIKNRSVPTFALLLVLVAGCFWARAALHLAWRIAPFPGLVRDVALGLSVILACDVLVHGALTWMLGDRYRRSYHALADYFRPQGPLEIGAGALLAGGEELFFRGILLQGLMDRAGLGAGAGLGVSALTFGALHWLRDPRLAPFTLWALWEGVVLGCLYLAFGSLLVSMIVHAAHDLIGFTLFARERQLGATGCVLAAPKIKQGPKEPLA
jgi:membrane protease YdiL (CAAX protease family)